MQVSSLAQLFALCKRRGSRLSSSGRLGWNSCLCELLEKQLTAVIHVLQPSTLATAVGLCWTAEGG